MSKTTFSGLLSLHSGTEDEAWLYLSTFEKPLAYVLYWLNRKVVTIKYWITDREEDVSFIECSKGEMPGAFVVKSISGKMKIGIQTIYYLDVFSSEEDIIVGGHDLLSELKNNVGKWLILEIEYDDII